MKNNGDSPQPTQTLRRTGAQIQQLLEEYRQSKLTQRAFAARAGVGFSTLRNWLRKSRIRPRSSTSASWVEVQLPASAMPSQAAADYRLEIRGSTLHVPRGFELREVGQLVQLLSQAP